MMLVLHSSSSCPPPLHSTTEYVSRVYSTVHSCVFACMHAHVCFSRLRTLCGTNRRVSYIFQSICLSLLSLSLLCHHTLHHQVRVLASSGWTQVCVCVRHAHVRIRRLRAACEAHEYLEYYSPCKTPLALHSSPSSNHSTNQVTYIGVI